MIDLIDAKHDRLMRTAQHFSNFRICCRDAFTPVNKEHNHISRFDCKFSLAAHLRADDVIPLRFDAARIHQCKIVFEPCCIAIDPVTRNTRRVFHDGDPFSYDLIEKS